MEVFFNLSKQAISQIYRILTFFGQSLKNIATFVIYPCFHENEALKDFIKSILHKSLDLFHLYITLHFR